MTLLRTENYINGAWCQAHNKATYTVYNPANGTRIADVPDMEACDAIRAIEYAERALIDWRLKSAYARASLLRNWFELIMKNREGLARILTQEQGKPLAESRAEVDNGCAHIEWFAEEAKRQYGETIPAKSAGQRLTIIKQPVGVCAAITPWNFPMSMIVRKAAPALAAGCTIVVKPAEATPLSALALAHLADEAGIPKGVFNVITCSQGERVGSTLCTHPSVRKLSFTGSTEVGKQLLSQCSETVKRTSMELGGNAPLIVFDDADIALAVDCVIASKFRNSGQTCISANRIYVQSTIHDVFVSALADAMSKLKIGNGLDADVSQGPLINENAIRNVERLVAAAKAQGAVVEVGGCRHSAGSLFFEPTMLTSIKDEMSIAREEVFGPVASISSFDDEDEVITKSNDTPYGLAAYVFSENVYRITRLSESLEFGMIGVNSVQISAACAPFGGIKESGFGREGARQGLDEYLEAKYICMGGL